MNTDNDVQPWPDWDSGERDRETRLYYEITILTVSICQTSLQPGDWGDWPQD